MVSQILLDALQQKRFGGKLRTIQRKKLNVEPGKSIGDDDDEFEEEEEEEEEEIEEEEDPTASEEEDNASEEDPASEEEIAERMNVDADEQDVIAETEQGVVELEDFEESVNGRWVIAKFLMGRKFQNYVGKVVLEYENNTFNVLCLQKSFFIVFHF